MIVNILLLLIIISMISSSSSSIMIIISSIIVISIIISRIISVSVCINHLTIIIIICIIITYHMIDPFWLACFGALMILDVDHRMYQSYQYMIILRISISTMISSGSGSRLIILIYYP